VEAGPGRFQARFVAIDLSQANEQFRIPVPQSLVTRINVAGERSSCIPDFHSKVPQAFGFSRLLVNTDGNVYFAFTLDQLTLQAVDCTPETAFHAVGVHAHYDESLFLWKLSPDGTLVSTLVARDTGESAPFNGPRPLILPTGDLIPDGAGRALIAVRQIPGGNHSSPDSRHDYIYRITQAGKLAYKLALPATASLRVDDGIALNDENRAFTTVGGVVLCFDSLSGQEQWRYDSGTERVAIIFAKEEGGVVVQDGNKHLLSLDKNGNKTADEDFDPAHEAPANLPD
jgi:outer membrane protein assembly factor BamB